MQFKIDRKEFAKGIVKLQGIAEKNQNTPILGSILFESKGPGQISLFGTNLEISLSVPCPAEVVSEGKMAIEGRKLYEIVKELPDGPVTCSLLENQSVQIVSGKSKFKLQSYNPEDFPVQQAETEEFQFTMTSKEFLEKVKRTAFSVGENDSRYVLNGLLIYYKCDEKGASVRFVGTDGHRLAISAGVVSSSSVGSQAAPAFEKKLVVPKKAILEMKKLISESQEEKFILGCGKNQLVAAIGPVRFSARLMEGAYPDYAQIIPKEFARKVTFRKEEMIEAIQRVSVLSNQQGKAVKLAIDPEKATLSSQSENGEAEDQVPVLYEGAAIQTGFNGRYFLDALSAHDQEEVIMSLNDPISPVSFKSPADPNSLWIVMPMRV